MSKKKFLLSYVLFSVAHLGAQPVDPHVLQGDAKFHSPDPQTLEIQTGHHTKIQWNEFSIARGETTRFIQPSSSAVVINQVMGLNRSDLLGTLTANGHIYIINPQGIFIGPDAFIQTAGFIATTFDQLTLNEEGQPLHFKGDSLKGITHLGEIQTAGGCVMLVAAQIDLKGKIEGGDIIATAAPEVWIKPTEKGIYLIPQVSLSEIENSLDPMEFVIKQEGLIRATGCVENEGRIYLVASQSATVEGQLKGHLIDLLGSQVILEEKGEIDVSNNGTGGSVRIGGDYQGSNSEVPNASTTFMKGTILANSLESGNGGRVILWGNNVCDFQGKIQAVGGAHSGDGGFVEISSPLGLNFRGAVDLKAPLGKTGLLLLDPFDLTVQPNGGVNTNVTITGACPAGTNYQASIAGGGIIDNGLLATALNNCNVTLQTSAGSNGDIYILEAITGWTQPTTLTLQADHSVNWNWAAGTTAHFTETPSGSLNIQANTDINFVIPAGQSNRTLGFHTGTGSITLNAANQITLSDGSGNNNSVGIMSETGATQITTGNMVLTSTGNPQINEGVCIGVNDLMFNGGACFGTTINNPMTFNVSGTVDLVANKGKIQIGNAIDTDTLTSLAGTITFTNIGSSLQLIGTESVIQIGHELIGVTSGPASMSNCDINFNNIAGNVLLQANESLLKIGHTTGTFTYTLNGAINMQNIGGSFTISDTTPSLNISSIHIGHSAEIINNPPGSYNINGNILLGPIQNDFSMTTDYGDCFVGHDVLRYDDTVSGDITLHALGGSPSVLIHSGVSGFADGSGFAGIGHLDALLSRPHGSNVTTIGPEAINITAQNGLSLLSSSNQLAYIGFYNPSPTVTPHTENINISALNITTGAGQPLTMIGGSTAALGKAFIGAQNSSGTLVCPITIQGPPVMQMTVPTGTGQALIQNTASGAASTITVNTQSLALNAGSGTCMISSADSLTVTSSTGSISLANDSQFRSVLDTLLTSQQDLTLTGIAQIASSRALLAQATLGSISIGSLSSMTAVADSTLTGGVNISLGANGFVTISNGSLELIVDNLFPTSPTRGPGAFILSSGASVFSPVTLKIYTSSRDQNNVSGLLNGQPFVPGALFVDSSQERWETYYPFAGLGSPFTLFYKNGPTPPPAPPFGPNGTVTGTMSFHRFASEYLQDLQRFDEITIEPYVLIVDLDFPVQKGTESYKFLVPYRRDYHLKWLEPATFLGR